MAKQKAADKGKKKTPKAKKISYHRQPEELTIRDWQLALRKQYGAQQTYQLSNLGTHPVWSDFMVTNPENKTAYRVAIRGLEVGTNFCACPDFRTNTLGTCKHIEWALVKLYDTHGNKQHIRKAPPERAYSSLAVDYSDGDRKLRLRIGSEREEDFRALATPYIDEDGVILPERVLEVDRLLEGARALTDTFRCYPDALDLIIERRDDERRRRRADALPAGAAALAGLVKADLYPYQVEGALFCFRAGRALLADEMGLGKTIQAICAAELFGREMGIESVFVICPTSLKYQWQSEIEKFTGKKALVVEGNQLVRKEQYKQDEFFYKILTYNVVARDYKHLNDSAPDLIILDEAQRIKNYDTKIAHAVKRLRAPHRIALTGTPLENKLEDIYSIVQFLDQYRLGPLWRLQARHEARDENNMVRGYRNLDEISRKLEGLMLRRRKRDVAQQLPPRVDQNLLVPMTAEQQALHEDYSNSLAQLVAKWRRLGFLTEKDRRNLMSLLVMMRMSCDSTFLIDQVSRHDTKIGELFFILEEHLAEAGEKAVIFSQWERMTRIVAQELEQRGIGFANLNGSVPSTERGALLERFREDEECRVFLSTDAGGVGLNLQCGALVVNLDLPWNPAVLEQRIARVHRLGQTRGVQVINLISEGTIEHRMVDTLRFKSSLAEAVLDTSEDSVFMNDRKFGDFMERLERVQGSAIVGSGGEPVTDDEDLETSAAPASTATEQAEPMSGDDDFRQDDTPDGPAPAEQGEPAVTASADPSGNKNPQEGQTTSAPASSPAPAADSADSAGTGDTTPGTTSAPRPGGTAPPPATLVAEGVGFLSRLATTLADERATQQLLGEITERDDKGQTYLKIPVESLETVGNVLKLLGGLLGG